MLTKIEVFAYIQWKFTKTSPRFFFKREGGGTRARRAGPGSAFAILSMNNTWWMKMCTIALNFIFFVVFRLHNECFNISLNHVVWTVFSETCITDETPNARHFMIISSFNFTNYWFVYIFVLKGSESISPVRHYAQLSMKDTFWKHLNTFEADSVWNCFLWVGWICVRYNFKLKIFMIVRLHNECFISLNHLMWTVFI